MLNPPFERFGHNIKYASTIEKVPKYCSIRYAIYPEEILVEFESAAVREF